MNDFRFAKFLGLILLIEAVAGAIDAFIFNGPVDKAGNAIAALGLALYWLIESKNK